MSVRHGLLALLGLLRGGTTPGRVEHAGAWWSAPRPDVAGFVER